MGLDPYNAAALVPALHHRAIGDYNLVGDCRAAALVANDGAIDWCCLPDFNAPPILSRLLGAAAGGYLTMTMAGNAAITPQALRQRYVPSTAILQTEVRLASGRLLITDFMTTEHLRGHVTPQPSPRLVRRIEALDSRCSIAIRLQVALDYGNKPPRLIANEEGVLAINPGVPGVTLLSFADVVAQGRLAEPEPGLYISEHTLKPQEPMTLVLGWAQHQRQAQQLLRAFRRDWSYEKEATRVFWQNWAAQTIYFGPYRQTVIRSAITLKLLPFAPATTPPEVAPPPTPEFAEGYRQRDNTHSNGLKESQDVRVSNRQMILRLLREQGSSTRAALARATGLSRTTIGTIIAELIEKALVQEGDLLDAASTGGRRPTRVTFQPNAGIALGVQVLPKIVSVVATNLQGMLLAQRQLEKDFMDDPYPVILTLAHEVALAAGFQWEQVVGMGLALPDAATESRLHEDLRQRLHIPVTGATPLVLGVAGEQRQAHQHAGTCAIYLQCGPQLGFGIVRADPTISGEIFPLAELLDDQERAQFADFLRQPENSLTLLAELQQSSPLALTLLDRMGDALAELTQLFHPYMITLDMFDAALSPSIIAILRQRLALKTPSSPATALPISMSQIHPGAVVLGAASLAIEVLFGSLV